MTNVVGGVNNMISVLVLLSCEKFWAIQLLTSLRQSKIAARLPGSPGLSGMYICVSSASALWYLIIWPSGNTYIENKIKPKIEPCATPLVIGVVVEK